MRFFRRKSISEAHLQDDYPTISDSDEFSDDERRRQEWQQHLNRRATIANVEHRNNYDDQQWEYESEYNYSIGSDSSIIDAYKERSPMGYTEKDLESKIEHVMRNEMIAVADDRQLRKSPYLSSEQRRKRKTPYNDPEPLDVREPNRRHTLHKVLMDKADRFNSGDVTRSPYIEPRRRSPVTDRVRQFERSMGKQRSNNIPTSRFSSFPFRRESNEKSCDPPTSFGKKKVRKQMKHRRRAREVYSDMSDEEEDKKYSVNLTMDDLHDIIKRNVSSAVKSLNTEKSKRRLSPSDSFSTETETFFSGSSSHSTEISNGLLQKQIKAQLDKDKLRGIIKNAVAQETSEVLQKSLNVSTPSPAIPIINEIPPSPRVYHCHYGNQQQHATPQYPTPTQLQHSHIPPAPPPPPIPGPSGVSFNIPSRRLSVFSQDIGLPQHGMRRNSVAQGSFGNIYDEHFGNMPVPQDELFARQVGSFNRLQNRRHTLAAIDHPLSGSSPLAGDDLDSFSKALKLLDKTIKQAEEKSKDEDGKEASSKTDDVKPVSSDTIEPFPAGVLAPVQSIADTIAALSKKKEKPLEIGQIPMSACARTFLILYNIIFLVVGGGLSGLGVWMLTDPKIETYFDILNVNKSSSSFKMVCYALLAVGVFALLIAFMGCCGAIQKSKCLLTVFLVTVAVITVMEVGLGVMVLMSKESSTAIPVLSALMSDMENTLRTQLKQSLTEFYLTDTLVGTTWDKIQIELECCGATGPDDYKTSRWKNETRPETDYPDTCCVLVSKDAEVPEPSNKLLCHFGTAGFFFETGCYEKMLGWFKDNSLYILGASGAILLIEIVGFISAFIICKQGVKKKAKETKRTANNNPGQNVTNTTTS